MHNSNNYGKKAEKACFIGTLGVIGYYIQHIKVMLREWLHTVDIFRLVIE